MEKKGKNEKNIWICLLSFHLVLDVFDQITVLPSATQVAINWTFTIHCQKHPHILHVHTQTNLSINTPILSTW